MALYCGHNGSPPHSPSSPKLTNALECQYFIMCHVAALFDSLLNCRTHIAYDSMSGVHVCHFVVYMLYFLEFILPYILWASWTLQLFCAKQNVLGIK